MPAVRLTISVLDREKDTRIVGAFYRSPVLVGRDPTNGLRMHASTVSRHHGAFLFSTGLLQYVDLGSTNGSIVDGIRAEPDVPIDVRPSSIIVVGPFELTVDLHLVAHDGPDDADATGRVEQPVQVAQHASRRAPVLKLVPGVPGASDWRSPASLPRALQVISVVAEFLVDFKATSIHSASPLQSADDPEKIVAYLVEPDGNERLAELRAALTDLALRPPPTPIREGTS